MGKAGRTQWHHVAGSTGLVALQPQHFLLLKLGKSCMVVGACRCTGRVSWPAAEKQFAEVQSPLWGCPEQGCEIGPPVFRL